MSLSSPQQSVCSPEHQLSGDLNKVKESSVTIRWRCTRVMPYLLNTTLAAHFLL